MLDKLKEETKSAHQSVEKILVSELKKLSSKEDYANLLIRLHEFYEPLESKLHSIINESIIPDIDTRKHVDRIANDLKFLDLDLKTTSKYTETVNLPSISYALGVLYVIEGSTLGGQVISKMIQKQVKLSDNKGISYFASYGDNTPTMWRNFKKHIADFEREINENEMITGARITFQALENWLIHSKV